MRTKKVAKRRVVRAPPVKKAKKPAITKNYLMMVLDESSSMETIRDQAISAFNEQVKAVKATSGKIEVVVDLVKFSSEVSVVFQNEKLDTVKDLDRNTYTPNSMTAMYDGVGKAIELLKARPDINDPGVTVLMLIISDGAENCSRAWSSARVADELRALQATGKATVTYAGANQDLAHISQTLNIPYGNTSVFVASAAGMSANNVLRAQSTSQLYANYTLGETSVQSFYTPPKS
jgi:hypothetical protein